MRGRTAKTGAGSRGAGAGSRGAGAGSRGVGAEGRDHGTEGRELGEEGAGAGRRYPPCTSPHAWGLKYIINYISLYWLGSVTFSYSKQD